MNKVDKTRNLIKLNCELIKKDGYKYKMIEEEN